MGAFTLNFTVGSIIGAILESPGYGGYDEYYIGVNVGGGGPESVVSGQVTYNPSTIELDGNAPISLDSLPSGFNLNGTTLFGNGSIAAVGSVQQRTGIALSGQAQLIARMGTATPVTSTQPFTSLGPVFTNATYQAVLTAVLDLFLTFVNQLSVSDAAIYTSLSYKTIKASGPYQIISTQWEIINLTRPGATDFAAGERAKVHAKDNSWPHFDTVDEIKVYPNFTIIPSDFIVIDVFFIIFIIPDDVPPGPTPTTISNGTQFTGSAFLQLLDIVTINTSGIYTLVDNLRHDTQYTDSGSGNTTQNAAIPTPFFKTGFIGG